MKTISTALTRPRSSFGVISPTVVERMLTLIRSTNPAMPSAATESSIDRESPKTIMHAPKIPTTTSSVGPARVWSGRRARMIPAASAPTAGALRRTPSPTGPTWRISRAKTGASAIAPPKRTAKRSSAIAPSSIRVRNTNRTPSASPAKPGACSTFRASVGERSASRAPSANPNSTAETA